MAARAELYLENGRLKRQLIAGRRPILARRISDPPLSETGFGSAGPTDLELNLVLKSPFG